MTTITYKIKKHKELKSSKSSNLPITGKKFFFLSGFFFSRTLKTHRTAGEGREPSFIPFYHFHLVSNIQTFISNFACEMTITYFLLHRLYLPDCYSMRFTTLSNYHLTDWWCDVSFCLFTWWFDTEIDTRNRWSYISKSYISKK